MLGGRVCEVITVAIWWCLWCRAQHNMPCVFTNIDLYPCMVWKFEHTNVFRLCKRWVCGNYYLFTISCMCNMNIRALCKRFSVSLKWKWRRLATAAVRSVRIKRHRSLREHRNGHRIFSYTFFALLYNFAFAYVKNSNHISEPRMLSGRSTQDVVYVIAADVRRKRCVSLNWHWTENSIATKTK